MTTAIQSLAEIADHYDAIVLDQWGVLHNGSEPYPGVIAALDSMTGQGHRLAVLSNSGKRSAPNVARMAEMGYASGLFSTVMTAGEALWHDLQGQHVPHRRFYVIEGRNGDAAGWAHGLDVVIDAEIDAAEAVLLMGLPDHSTLADWQPVLAAARARGLIVYCSNPDHIAPRTGGQTVLSPGSLAQAHEQAGGTVVYYGKPHKQVFAVLGDVLQAPPERLLMVGDSPDHDIAGADAAGWDSLLVFGGLCRDMLADADRHQSLAAYSRQRGVPMPTYSIELLR